MKTLKDILVMKDEIISLATQLGFKNVRIFHEEKMESEIELHLVVSEAEAGSVSYKNSTYLSAMLAEMLNCDVKITVEENINELYKYHFMQNSVSISEENKVLNLFKNDSQSIRFKETDSDENNKKMRAILVKQGKESIKNSGKIWGSNTPLTFMTNKPLEDKEDKDFEKKGETAFSQNFKSESKPNEEEVSKFLSGILNSACKLGLSPEKILKDAGLLFNGNKL